MIPTSNVIEKGAMEMLVEEKLPGAFEANGSHIVYRLALVTASPSLVLQPMHLLD